MLIMLFCYALTYLVMRMRHKVHIPPVTYYDENDDAPKLPRKTGENSDESVESFLLQVSGY